MLERLVLYQDWLYVDTEAGVAYRKVGGEYRRTGTVDAHGYVVCNRLRKLYKVHRVVTEQEAVDWVVCKRKELHGEYAKA